MKKYSISLVGLIAFCFLFSPFFVLASGEILLDTKTGRDYVQVIYPHYGFTPTTSGTLESIDVAFTATNPLNPTYDFVVNLEYPFFNPIDCVSDVVPGSSGNSGSTDHSIVTTISGFHGKDCALVAGQMYGIDFGSLRAFGGIFGDASSVAGYGIYRGSLPPTCADGIQNQNETGADTGGICDTSNALLDDFTGKGFDHTGGVHFSFTPEKSGTLTGVTGYFVNQYPGVAYTGAHLEDVNGFRLDCDAMDNVDFNSINLHTVLSGWTNFSGPGCHLNAGTTYRMNTDMNSVPHATDGVWVSDPIGVHPKVIFYGILDTVTPPPPAPTCTENCFSNVLFLPGIKGSVLQNSNDTIWPPTAFSNDVSQLALTSAGESVNDIKVDGIINESYGKSIYGPFSEFMDGLVSDKEINQWLPMGYDWRFSPEKILNEGIKTPGGTIDVIAEIEKLATDSKSGKVTIVGHSMGGLLGKAIIKKLVDLGKDNLVDSFVMVGTPELGTPQTIAAILNGGNGDFDLANFVANPIPLRKVSINMPSAYNLLPSLEYFHKVQDPVVTIDPLSTFLTTWVTKWGPTINTYSNLFSFLTGGSGIRTQPADKELSKPVVLQSGLLSNASSFHNTFDTYQFPEHIRVVEVAGWGTPTVKAVNYKTVHGVQSYDVSFTLEGDKTVVYKSAVSSNSNESYFFNTGRYRKDTGNVAEHNNLLSSTPVQNVLSSIIKNISIQNTNFISIIKPQVTELSDQLVVSAHSPVILGAHDQSGNFTGIDRDQDLSAELLSFSEEIPGSSFVYTGESQYIFLPKNGTYNFVYKATGEGPTTTKIENFSADTTTPIATYLDVPTKLNTEATFIVDSGAPQNTKLNVDFNGDGNVDANFGATPVGVTELYPFNGFSQPIDDATYQPGQTASVFKAGSTVPVKFQLKKSNGVIVQAKTLPLWLPSVKMSAMSATVDESVANVATTTGSNFKWDTTSQQYVYNWSTKGMQPGYWYKLSIQLDDGSVYNVTVGLK